MEEERIIEKIRRLFELSKSKNEYESTAAAEKAQELLYKYNIDESDVYKAKKHPYIRAYRELKDKSDRAQWLYSTIAQANGCGIVLEGGARIAIIGQAHVIEVVDYSYQQMSKRINWLMDLAWDIYVGPDPEHVYKDAFKYGLIMSLYKNLKANRARLDLYFQGNALMVQDELEIAIKSYYPHLGRSGSMRGTQGEGRYDGEKSGRHLHVNEGLKDGGMGQRRLGS